MSREIYLDNNATTQPIAEVRDAMLEVLGNSFGNPSSSHSCGERGREHLRHARQSVASLLDAEVSGITFTGSGTEANHLVIASATRQSRRRPCRIITSSVEHSSVLRLAEHLRECDQQVEIVVVPVDNFGLVDVNRIESAITADTTLVSIQWVNNETGVIQPIRLIGELCRSHDVPFHTDAAQAIGKLTIRVAEIPVDLLTMTAHKIHGPQGVGAVYALHPRWMKPIFFGGSQENSLRAGTENLSGIAGFGKAAEIRGQQLHHVAESLGRLRDRFERQILESVPDVVINGDPARRVCNTTNLQFIGLDGQGLVARLDQAGVRCSQSSACTNQRPEPSYVLRAMGLSEEEAYSSVRFSFGVHNTEDEVDQAVCVIREMCQQLRGFAALIKNPYQAART